MNADWVAVSVRARSMSRRRLGAGACREVAAQPSLADAVALLDGSAYAVPPSPAPPSLARAQRVTRDVVLWQLRVLAGWLPGRGDDLVRAAAAAFERDNVLALAERLGGGGNGLPELELGSLATAWPRLREATSVEELLTAVHRSRWGDVGSGGAASLSDVLTVAWLRRLAAAAPEARPWAAGECALLVARIVLVDQDEPSERLRQLVRPFIGASWASATSLDELRLSLPVAVRPVLDGVARVEELWRAEAALRARVEADGFTLLRGPRPGHGVVLGAMAVLSIDAWRVRAALAAAAVGVGSSEVLDAVA